MHLKKPFFYYPWPKALRYFSYLFIVATTSIFPAVHAQNTETYINEVDTNATYKLTRYDGVYHVGRILSINESEVIMILPGRGKLIIPAYLVASIKKVKDNELDKNGVFIEGINDLSHYILNTNAQGIEAGEVELGVHWLGPSAIIGITDRKSVRLATSWVGAPLGLTYTYQIPISKKVNTTLGILGGWGSWLDYESGMVMPFAGITFGGPRQNVSLTAGYNRVFMTRKTVNNPFAALSAVSEISKRWSLVFDSFVFQEGTEFGNFFTGAAFLAPRYTFVDRNHIEFGGGVVVYDGEIWPVPILQFFHKF